MRLTLAALAMLACASVATAATQSPTRTPPPPAFLSPPPVRAVRTDRPVTVDGLLNEEIWKADNAVTSLYQQDPDQFSPTRQRTEVRVAYDDDALYIGARMYDTAPDSIAARLARRDQDTAADAFVVFLDPFRDKRTGYYFGVTAAGAQADGTLMNDTWNDNSWDGVWHVHVHRDSLGWTAEFKIPFSQLRFRNSRQMVWGVNFKRFISRSSETDELAFAPLGQAGFVSRFPELVGIERSHDGRTVELTPYLTTKAEYLVHSPGDPFHSTGRYRPASGGDLRTSVGSNLTLNATVNPDFGQVEIDPSVVNLSDVETYFGEKRPFFTEGLSVFRCGNNGANDYWGFNWADPTFFYTRRIGRAPEGSVTADYSDVPTGTHILGAAKITGQPAPNWSFGTLHAITNREFANLDVGGVRSTADVEPLSYYGVTRGQREFHDHRQGLGLMTTVAARSFNDADPIASEVNRSGVVTALDGWTFLDKSRTWVVSGWAAGTNVTGTRARLAALQGNSQHYFQRPDAGYLGVDSTATSMTGYGMRFWLNKQSGRLLSNSAFGFISPRFDNNDLGFLNRADLINEHTGLGWAWNDPHGWRQYANVIGAFANSWDFGGDHTMSMIYLGGQLEQRNHWSWNGNVITTAAEMNPRLTRGGPVMRTPRAYSGSLYFDTNGQNPFFWYVNVSEYGAEDGSWEGNVNPGITWKPMTNLSISGGPNWDRTFQNAQYVTTQADPAATATYGAHYVFAQLDQTTASAEFRVDWSMTPNLSLQTYLQPLISTGHYTDYKELARPRSEDFTHYDPTALPSWVPDANFTFRAVNVNMVMRWEYMPGSTFFVVWTQQRQASDANPQFNLDGSLTDLAHSGPNDVFMVKVAHHFEL